MALKTRMNEHTFKYMHTDAKKHDQSQTVRLQGLYSMIICINRSSEDQPY